MDHLGIAGQCRRPDPGRLVPHPIQHVVGCVDDAAAGRIRNRLQHNQIAKAIQQVGGKPPRIVPGVDHRFNRTEQCGGVAGGQGVDGVVDQRHVGGTQQRQRPLVVHPVAVGPGQQLIEHAQGVAG